MSGFSSLQDLVFSFFDHHIDPARPVMLGFSGGPDSVCLLHFLLDYHKKRRLLLHLVHIDHGWREESKKECEAIQEMALSLGLRLHTTRLAPQNKGNLEAQARQERLSYFTAIGKQIGAQGILLAHQLDDQCETVFKRFLEGVHLPHLSGMRPVSEIGALTLFRPLLQVSKKKILEWLQGRNLSYFEDPTNQDVRFLRARMRAETFPFLRQSFGKEFQENVCHIARDADEVRVYFDDKVFPYLAHPVFGPWGVLFDLSKACPDSSLEAKELFRRMGELYHISLNRSQLELAAKFLLENSANKWLWTQKKRLYIDRKKIFIIEEVFEDFPEMMKVKEGVTSFGPWLMTVRLGRGERKNHWLDIWSGFCSTVVPKGDYFLAKAHSSSRHAWRNKLLDRLWNEKKVPRALTSLCPMVMNEDGAIEDFLQDFDLGHSGDGLYIQLEKI